MTEPSAALPHPASAIRIDSSGSYTVLGASETDEVYPGVDEAGLAAALASFDEPVRALLGRAIRAADTIARKRIILRGIRAVLAESAPERPAIGVVFTASKRSGNFGDEYAMDSRGPVLFADLTTEVLDFGADLADLINALHGAFAGAVLAVDLRTETFDEYTDGWDSICGYFGVEDPDCPVPLINAIRDLSAEEVLMLARSTARILRISHDPVLLRILAVVGPDTQPWWVVRGAADHARNQGLIDDEEHERRTLRPPRR